MQQLVTIRIGGKPIDNRVELVLYLGNAWVPIHAIHEPPYRLRIVQIISNAQGWFALVESLP